VAAAIVASLSGVEPSGAAQALALAGSFLLAAVAVAIMWLRGRRD
jgi:hypothetical protein